MKRIKIAYWIVTGLFAFVMLGSAIPDILVVPMAVQGFKEIGYPAYLLPFLGWAKLLGVVTILISGWPRLKEWAYAGLLYDLMGATYSVASSGKSTTDWMPMLVFIAVGVGSYVLYHRKENAFSATNAKTASSPSASEPAPPAFY